METATRKAHTGRSTDRLLEALATLAALLDRTINEVKSLDGDFQSRLLQAVHDAETSLQSQAAQHLEQAIVETGDKVRRELTDKFTVEVNKIRTEFETEREQLAGELTRSAEAAALLESECARLSGELDRVQREAQSEIQEAQQAAHHFEQAIIETADKVRQELTEKFTAEVKRLQVEYEGERERLGRELTRSAESAAKLEAECSRLNGELERVREESRNEIQKAQESALAAAAAAAASSNGKGLSAAINDEIARAENRLREVVAIIDDPATELSTVIRKNVERSEIESYLKGIQFVVTSNGK
jgi:hypothetical protein